MTKYLTRKTSSDTTLSYVILEPDSDNIEELPMLYLGATKSCPVHDTHETYTYSVSQQYLNSPRFRKMIAGVKPVVIEKIQDSWLDGIVDTPPRCCTKALQDT